MGCEGRAERHRLVVVPPTHRGGQWYRTHERFRLRLLGLLDEQLDEWWVSGEARFRNPRGRVGSVADETLFRREAPDGTRRPSPPGAPAALLAARRSPRPRAALGWSRYFGTAELRVRRPLSRHSQPSISYRHGRNDGGFDGDDFSQSRVAAAFRDRL